MRYIRLDLLTLLIGLFSFSSCTPEDKIGLELHSGESVESLEIDTATIRTTTVREDTTQTSGIPQNTFGYINDPVVGTTESNLAFSVAFPNASFTFGTSPILDSAVLVLKYGDEFHGDSVNSTYRINVHQLSTAYDKGTVFYDQSQWSYDPNVIGTAMINKFAIHDTIETNLIRSGKVDSTVKRAPQLRIPLDPTFVNQTFFSATQTDLETSTAWNSFFKGLYLTIDKSRSTGSGGITTFNLASTDSSRVELYYRHQTGAQVDTNVAAFPISYFYAANNIVHTYTPAVKNQLSNPKQEFSTVFVQPMAGLRTRLNFPYIDKLKSLGKIAINKAELVIQVVDQSLDPALRLTLYRSDIAGQRRPIPDNNIGQISSSPLDPRYLNEYAFGGFYDKGKKRYVIRVTSYIQDLIDGKLSQYNTYLGVIKSTNSRSTGSDLKPFATTAARSVLGGGNHPQYKMKLNILYTKVK